MSRLIPIHWITKERRQSYLEEVRASVEQIALNYKVIMDRHDCILRDGLGDDFGLSPDWVTPPLKQGWNTYFIHQIRPQQTIGFFGVIQTDQNPVLTTMRISEGIMAQTRLAIFNLQVLYGNMIFRKNKLAIEEDISSSQYDDFRMEGLFTEPVVMGPGKIVHIEVYSSEDKPQGEKLVPLIIIAEPRGMVIS